MRNVALPRVRARTRDSAASRDLAIVGISIALIGAMCLHWMRPGFVIETGDNYWQYRPLHALLRGAAAWNHFDAVAGSRSVAFYGIPWLLLSAAFTAVGGESFSQIAMLWLMRTAQWTGAYLLCRELRATRWASLGAAWALLLNPYVHTITVANPSLEWLLATFVWIALLSVKAATVHRFRSWATFWLATVAGAIFLFAAQNPGLILLCAIATPALLGLGGVVARDRRAYGRWATFGAAAMLATALWWIVPAANFYLGSTVTADTKLADVNWVVRDSSLLNNLRFIPTWSWAFPTYFPYARAFDANAVTYVSSYTLATLLAIGLAVARGRKAAVARYGALVALAMLFVSKGVHPPLSAVNEFLYRLPGFIVFREPTSKAPLLALVMIVPVAAFAIDGLASRTALAFGTVRRVALAAWTVVVLAASAASAYPLLTGEVFHDSTPGLPSVYTALPQYWRDAARYLNAQPNRSALLVLPTDTFYQADYRWGYHGYDGLAYLLFDRPVEQDIPGTYTQVPEVHAVAQRIERAVREHSPIVRSLLADFNVRYVLYRNDVRIDGDAPLDEREVAAIPAVGSPRRFGALDLFDLGPVPSTASESREWIADDGVKGADAALELRAMFENVPRIDAAKGAAAIAVAPELIEDPGALAPALTPNTTMLSRPAHRFVATTAAAAAQNVQYHSSDVVKAGFLRSASERTFAIFAAAELSYAPVGRSTVLLHDEPASESGRIGRIDVINPTPEKLRFDLAARVPLDGTAYVLTTLGYSWASGLPRFSEPGFARFTDVVAQPGRNVFRLGRPGAASIGFDELRFERAVPITQEPIAANPGIVRLERHSHPHEIFGGFRLDVPAAANPSVRIEVEPNAPALDYGAIANISFAGRTYDCYVAIASGEEVAIGPAIRACLTEGLLHRQITADDLAATLVRRIDLDAALPPKTDMMSGSAGVATIEADWDATAPDAAVSRPISPAGNAIATLTERTKNTFTYRVSRQVGESGGNILGKLVEVKTNDATIEGRVESVDQSGMLLRDLDGSHEWRPNARIERVGILGAGSLDVHLAWTTHGRFQAGNHVALAVDGTAVDSGTATFEASTPRGHRRVVARLHRMPGDAGAFVTRSTNDAFGAAGGSIERIALDLRIPATVGASQPRVRIALPSQLDAAPHLDFTLPARTTATARNAFVEFRPRRNAGQIELGSLDPRLSVLAIGPDRQRSSQRSEPVAVEFDGFMMLNRAGGVSAPAIVTTHEAYDSQWVGMCLGRCTPILKHFRVDGYRNGWFADGPGIIVLFEVIVLIQLALGGAALGLLCVLFTRARRAGAQ